MNGSFMENIFIAILNMSISASWLIVAVMIVRAFTKKAPKGLRYVLWAFVAIRLLCPFSLESAWSLIPSAETVSKESVHSDTPEITSGVGVVVLDEAANSVLSGQTFPNTDFMGNQTVNADNGSVEQEVLPDETVDVTDGNIGSASVTKNEISLQGIVYIATRIWLVGIVVMLVYSLISFIRLSNTIKPSLQIGDNLLVCDDIQSPFIFGLIRPRIYLPSFIDQEQVPYIVAHEKAHLKYHDHWWKPFGFGILIIHWFNPLVWIAYILLCRDIELACDERVIQKMDADEKKKYSKSLLLCSNPRHMISACPVAFGEIGVKERIKSILNYKKPSTWIVGIGIVACVILSICFMTNPKNEDIGDSLKHSAQASVEDTEIGLQKDIESELLENTESTEYSGEIEIKGSPLSETELAWFATEFFNSDENLMPNMFLSSEYDCPENIAINNLFYSGSNGRGGGVISEEEERLLLEQYYGEDLLDVSRSTVDEMDDILRKYMNITLEDTNKVHIEGLYYLPEYDAYYNVAGDTEYSKYELLTGWKNENGTITIVYKNAFGSDGTRYQVTLKQENGNYYFLSNIQMPIDMRVFVANEITEEQIVEDTYYINTYTSMWNEENGYELRCSTPGAGQMTKILCKTSDGGGTYDEYLDVSCLPNYPCGIYFFTEKIGYIVTDYHGSYTFLYRTEDGGLTWRGQMIYVPVSWYRYVNGISIDNGILRIQVVTDDEIYNFEYETDDMGETWKLK